MSRLFWLGASQPQLLFSSCHERAPATSPACGRLEQPDVPYDPSRKSLTDDAYRSYALARIGTLYLRERKDVVDGLIDVFVARLADIQTRVSPVPTLFVLIPDELQVSPAEVDRVLAWDPTISRDRLDVDHVAAAIAERLSRSGVQILDLRPAFLQEGARGRRLYAPNDGHLSPEGTALASGLIGEALRKRGVY